MLLTPVTIAIVVLGWFPSYGKTLARSEMEDKIDTRLQMTELLKQLETLRAHQRERTASMEAVETMKQHPSIESVGPKSSPILNVHTSTDGPTQHLIVAPKRQQEYEEVVNIQMAEGPPVQIKIPVVHQRQPSSSAERTLVSSNNDVFVQDKDPSRKQAALQNKGSAEETITISLSDGGKLSDGAQAPSIEIKIPASGLAQKSSAAEHPVTKRPPPPTTQRTHRTYPSNYRPTTQKPYVPPAHYVLLHPEGDYFNNGPVYAPPPDTTLAPYTFPSAATAQQSNSMGSYSVADRAIDGHRGGNHYSHACTSTGLRNKEPWWEVDFGEEMTVNTVWLFNRGDCCSSFMRDLTITVDGELCNRFKGPAPSGYLAKPAAVVECVVPLIGRTLRISKQGRDLILCEVEWY